MPGDFAASSRRNGGPIFGFGQGGSPGGLRAALTRPKDRGSVSLIDLLTGRAEPETLSPEELMEFAARDGSRGQALMEAGQAVTPEGVFADPFQATRTTAAARTRNLGAPEMTAGILDKYASGADLTPQEQQAFDRYKQRITQPLPPAGMMFRAGRRPPAATLPDAWLRPAGPIPGPRPSAVQAPPAAPHTLRRSAGRRARSEPIPARVSGGRNSGAAPAPWRGAHRSRLLPAPPAHDASAIARQRGLRPGAPPPQPEPLGGGRQPRQPVPERSPHPEGRAGPCGTGPSGGARSPLGASGRPWRERGQGRLCDGGRAGGGGSKAETGGGEASATRPSASGEWNAAIPAERTQRANPVSTSGRRRAL